MRITMDLTMPMRCPKGHLSTDAEYCSECGARMPDAASGLGVASTPPVAMPAMGGSVDSEQVCPDCGTPRANHTAVFCEVCRYNFVTHTSWATPKVSGSPPPPLAAPAAAPASPPLFADASASAGTPAGASSVSPAIVAAMNAPPAALTSTAPPVQEAVPPDAAPDASADGAAMLPDGGRAQDLPSQAVVSNGGYDGGANGLTQAPITRWEVIVAVDPSLYTDPDPQIPCPVGEPERVYSLDFADNLIGRRSEKRDIHPEINLNDACVSHRHAKIQRLPDGAFALLDVGSTNGTHLNGVELQPAVRTPLHDGDQITLGCWTRITVRGLRG